MTALKSWWYWNGDTVVFFIVIVVLVAGVILGSAKASEASCNARTEGMGFAHDWSFFGGCRIEVSEGQWIPLGNYYFRQQ